MIPVLRALAASSYFLTDDLGEISSVIDALLRIEPAFDIAQALSRASDALRQGDDNAALAQLLYAQRLSPSDRLITLLIGDIRLMTRRPEAVEQFEFIADRHNWSGAWYRLATARLRREQFADAVSALHGSLSQNAPFLDPRSCGLAARLAEQTGAPGWAGVSNSGRISVGGLASGYDGKNLQFVLDGSSVTPSGRMPLRQRRLTSWLLPDGWSSCQRLEVFAKGRPMIGSPIDIAAVTRMEGMVETRGDEITGWAWLPGEAAAMPIIRVQSAGSARPVKQCVAELDELTYTNLSGLAWPKRFSFAVRHMPQRAVRITGPHGRSLYGSPVDPWGSIKSGMAAAARIARRFPAIGKGEIVDGDGAAEISMPASHRGIRSRRAAREAVRNVLVVIPVYKGLAATLDCIGSVVEHKSAGVEILVISDASPDVELVQELRKRARGGAFELRLEGRNRGFPGAANIGLRHAAQKNCDVILLNSDTVVTSGWVAALRRAAYGARDIGTATPLSNAATIFSYPLHHLPNPVPDAPQIETIAAICAKVNAAATVEVPTAHGFCMFIKHECLMETGILRDETFAQGYGEENDFCLRARHLGWRHVAVPGAYVAHVEGASFGRAKAHLVRRNLDILNRLHPGYDALVAAWERADPLAHHRRDIDRERWLMHQGGRHATCFVTHDREGGVLRHVEQRAKVAEENGVCAIILKPGRSQDPSRICEIASPFGLFPNLRFRMADEFEELRSFLADRNISHFEIHHFIGHDPSILTLVEQSGAGYEMHIHDFSWFCPRITLTAKGDRYCGEPDVKTCTQCVADFGTRLHDPISPAALILRSQKLFAGADRRVVPSNDTARRFEAKFDGPFSVLPWEDDSKPLQLKRGLGKTANVPRRICILGAIGPEKGYDVILACARFAAQHALAVTFHIVGFTCDDERLLQTGKVRITGRYAEHEALDLIKAQDADMGFLPALWPETWSFVLTQLWEAQLPVFAFDIGAPAERIKARNGGVLFPVGFPIEGIMRWFVTGVGAL